MKYFSTEITEILTQKPEIFTSAWWRFTQVLKAITGKHLHG